MGNFLNKLTKNGKIMTAVYKLIKNNKVDNIIIADEIDSIRDQYDAIEEVIETLEILEPTIKKIGVDEVRNFLTFDEKVVWDNDLTPSIKTAKLEFIIPKNLEETTNIINFLISKKDISTETKENILSFFND